MLLERTRAARAERLEIDTLQVFAPKEYVLALRAEGTYGATGRNGITLVKTPRLRVVLEVLRGGEELREHRAPGPITLHVVEGAIRFHLGEEVFRVRAGEMLALPEGSLHSVEAVCDSAFVLTIVPVGDEADGPLPKAPARE